MSKKTSVDYKKDLEDLKDLRKSLELAIRDRVKEMIEQNPNVSMGVIDYANAPSKEVFVRDYKHIDRYDMSTIFDLMETIETELNKK